MTNPDPLGVFYTSLSGKGAKPLAPDDPYYVPILQETPEKDPILELRQRILWAESESVNLLTGYRGNGKSTELKRLKKELEDADCRVFLVDMLDYLLMTKPLELSDFVLSLMAALTGAVELETDLQPLTHSYWDRLGKFLVTEVQVDNLGLEMKGSGAAAKLGLKLKTEPDFKERIQQHLRGHLARLIEDACEYVNGLVESIRAGDPEKKVVLLVDSVEQLRGVGEEAEQVHQSVVELFSGQAANLCLPKLHLVYTVPPYLSALAPNLGRSLGGHPIARWPNVHVRTRDHQSDTAGLEVMEQIIEQRYPNWRKFISPTTLHRLAACSGGDLRDYFRLVRECLIAISNARIKNDAAILSDEMVAGVIQQLCNELLPISDEDAHWLARIHETKKEALSSTKDLPALARFLDSNLIMNYLNGEPWYDIHPLIVDEIEQRADNTQTDRGP